ncbi:tRNA-guanine transglycosylase DpdA [Kineococcus sp. SYSU DK005]|uniref:tRNA-guanine transglycosylase DpdA n=1 Tax=Kineococcus sp. SYSU DK005 TaxID=3383126 RepID=UPI003D7DCAD4
MKFYFPDSQDLISPTYDFERDEYHPLRVRQRDDRYAHEVLTARPYDGILVSKGIVDGSISGAGKYSASQRARLYRLGVRQFFRLPDGVETLGDNGAFAYVTEEVPPVSVEQVLDFYEQCGFDAGVSLDHIVFGYQSDAVLESNGGVMTAEQNAWERRRELTLEYAADFLEAVRARGSSLTPVGAAQGWSPRTYANSVQRLQDMGYQRIALGGMVPLRTPDILTCLSAVAEVRKPETKLHLLGITRLEAMVQFAELGVTSLDSTSGFRQSFMDEKDNYHTANGNYAAIRVPQVDANLKLKRAILAGQISQATAVRLERESLRALRAYDEGTTTVEAALNTVLQYDALVRTPEERTKRPYRDLYGKTLEDRPWKTCSCGLCECYGIQMLIFRGTERNKRRGFHNLAVLAEKMHALRPSTAPRTTKAPTTKRTRKTDG